MKKHLLFMVAASFLAAVIGCDFHYSYAGNWSAGDLTAVTNIVQSAKIPSDLRHLNVDNRFGAVHITGTTNGTTGWTWKLTVRARNDSIAEQIANAVTCKAQLEGHTLNLVVSLPGSAESGTAGELMSESHSLQSDFEIMAPRWVAVQVQNRFGGVAIADLAGNVQATNKNGRLEIWNIDGGVRGWNSFGTLSASNTGAATLQNRNGDILAADIAGTLEADTRFGSLTAQDIHGTARLSNQNGGIRATSIHNSLNATTRFGSLVASNIDGSATLSNQNGRIEVVAVGGSLDANTSFDSLDARDIEGSVHLQDRNGAINVNQVKGDAELETAFGRLSAAGIQGDAMLNNRNGAVIASGVTGRVKASTSFGKIDITGAGSNFVCDNRNGEIRLRATSTTVTNIEAETSFATLEVHLPTGLNPAIQAQTRFGKINSDFPVLSNVSSPEQLTESAHASAWISLQNRNGRIRVVRD